MALEVVKKVEFRAEQEAGVRTEGFIERDVS
jgi:hypothetical protein